MAVSEDSHACVSPRDNAKFMNVDMRLKHISSLDRIASATIIRVRVDSVDGL